MSLRLSILDQTPIRHGSNAFDTLQETVQLAKLADKLGYTRYWISEHHNTLTIAGAAPEIIIARLAAETSSIRLGSGGIMLPNHSTLKVAENFRLLEAMYPGRIDLGIGRAPGGDRITAQLLNPSNTFDPKEYIEQISDLDAFFHDARTQGTIDGKVRAIPQIDTKPDIWTLTSSGESALLAAHFGLAMAYAQFINPYGAQQAVTEYKNRFTPSHYFSEPMAAVGIFGFCSEDEEKVKRAQAVMDYRLISFEKGKFDEMPTYDLVKDYQYTESEWQRVLFNRHRTIMGTPDEMKKKLTHLAETSGVDEIIIATFSEERADRFRSYELLANMFELSGEGRRSIDQAETLASK